MSTDKNFHVYLQTPNLVWPEIKKIN